MAKARQFVDARPQLRAIAPFAAVAAVCFALVPLPMTGGYRPAEVLAGIALSLLVVLAVAASGRRGMSAWIPAIAYLIVVALLRDAQGGTTSGYGPLVLLPVLWLALYGRAGELYAAIAGGCLVLTVPILVVGSPAYPETDWRRVIVLGGVALLVGLTTQRLVRRLREAESNLRTVGAAVRELPNADDARGRVCAAACDVSGADCAYLVEPIGDRELVVTACANVGIEGTRIAIGREPSGAAVAFASKQPFFAADVEGNPAVSAKIARPLNAASMLFQPVVRRDKVVGVLAVAWSRRVPRLKDSPADAMSVLAAEAAAAIEHNDLMRKLRELATTDELTGLPNRRSWEETLARESARAARSGTPLCVAVLDLDGFKELNDALGHQAADRLLKEIASAWTAEMRSSDVLGRYGGDEFILILPDCQLEDARSIVERVRGATVEGRTCSAGIAAWGPGEPLESAVRRADTALYRAKDQGRNRTACAPPPRGRSATAA